MQTLDYSGLPKDLQGGMENFYEYGFDGGHFLTACLQNNLVDAVNRADSTNLARLSDIVMWMFWNLPSECWGSKEKVINWSGNRMVDNQTIGDRETIWK